MENKIVSRSLNRQLDHVILHEVENGAAISNNLNANKVDQRFEAPKKVSKIKQKHLRIKERPAGYKTPHEALIIPCEVQTSETQKHTSNLQ